MRASATLVLSLLLFATLCALPFFAYAQPEGYEIWQHGEFGLSLTYPETWHVDERPETIIVPCIIEAPYDDTSVERDSFGAFVMPVYIGEGYFEQVNELAETWEETVHSDWDDSTDEPEFIIISRNTFETHQGYPAKQLEYIITDEDGNRIRWLVWLVLTETKKKAWVIGYCAKDDFELFESQAIDIIATAEFAD